MDKKIPPVPPKRPIPQKPNIVRQPPKKPIIKPTSESIKETKNQEEISQAPTITQTQEEIREKTLPSQQSDREIKVPAESKIEEKVQEPEFAKEEQNIATAAEISQESSMQNTREAVEKPVVAQPFMTVDNKKAKKVKNEKSKQELSVEKLNEKYKTILLSTLSAVCFVGAIICFIFMVL